MELLQLQTSWMTKSQEVARASNFSELLLGASSNWINSKVSLRPLEQKARPKKARPAGILPAHPAKPLLRDADTKLRRIEREAASLSGELVE
jgi:hypothetical protein